MKNTNGSKLFSYMRTSRQQMGFAISSSKLKKHVYQPGNKRLLVLFGIFLAIVAYAERPWFYTLTSESDHYIAYSTADEKQTLKLLSVAEILYHAYTDKFSELCGNAKTHPRLKLKIYKNRREFKSHNPFSGWAEAFYKKPYCQQYYDIDLPNPYHWMVHEATHQLNCEVAGVHPQKWLDEGLACYFGTSTIENNRLKLGCIDQNTYPIWWLSDVELSGDMQADIKNGQFIPLECIITNKGGPAMNRNVNKYYMHWWSLVHFLFHYENSRYSSKVQALLRDGGSLESFETNIGRIEEVQQEWYKYFYKKSYLKI